MNKQEEENQWVRMQIPFEHDNGEKTLMYMQTDGQRFVLSEHPDNKGPCVWNTAEKAGDSLLKTQIDDDPKAKPENFQMYVERSDGRFDQWEARTTKVEDISKQENHFEHKASEWLWKNEKQFEQADLEKRLDSKLEAGHLSQSRDYEAHMQQMMKDTALPKTEQSDQLRQAVAEQQARQAQEAAKRDEEAQKQQQQHRR